MRIPVWQIDAFADRPFTGNPAAVAFLEDALTDAQMQNIALEMNLSETAFVAREGDHFALRWFTPATEVDLCGHATLATAHFLWESGRLPLDERARFQTRSGELTASRADEWIELDFPADPPAEVDEPAVLADALGVRPVQCVQGRFYMVVEVGDAAQVRALNPDLVRLATIEVMGVIVTAPGDTDGVDFVSRFFGPNCGVDEDPVTGSAHCCLAKYWEPRLQRSEMVGYQVSSRGGLVRVRAVDDRVHLGGRAITVLRGELDLD